ncbi:hypothetical protein CON70_30185 [Bacillus pseudomycoides]|uniref:hypothetical protein n=1 Tax=Bacillus pseudomycoides TaxID=64104 RepID=UPI000BEBDF2B|nr:hypothetical protein [Bacillus pseudomycoides]PDZ08017.1 hypothetical protein CON70_30185 [Bacillus pseudomycoides]
MVQTHSNLYEISMSGGQELMWYNVEVKQGKHTYEFEIYRVSDTISVFYVDQFERQLAIASTKEMRMMLVYEEDKMRYRHIVGDAEWLLLDGIHNHRGMTSEEESAFLYLKENVLDEMVAKLEA